MSCFLRLLVLFIDKVPVDDAEPFIDVINAAVLILQVVSMFPDVQAEQRSLPFFQRVILVGSGKNFKLVAVSDEPCPAASETACGSSSKLFLVFS